jgi:hypothetical protein
VNLLVGQRFGSSDWLGVGLLFSIIIICLKHPKTLALWLREPLAAVGIMDNIGKRVVSDDIINQVITSSIAKVVRLFWRTDKYIANANGYGFGWRSHLPTARNNHVKLPLGGMGMQWPSRATRWNSDKLQIKRMTTAKDSDIF